MAAVASDAQPATGVVARAAPAVRRATYEDSQYGGIQRMRRLLEPFSEGEAVRGATHEGEHVFGYKVLAPNLPRGRSRLASQFEARAPAYLEERGLHRAHIGTGSRRGSGAYRESQRTLLDEQATSPAVQLNQLEYAHIEIKPADIESAGRRPFQEVSPELRSRVANADRSYGRMASRMQKVELTDDGSVITDYGITSGERAEMVLGRLAARQGRWPRPDEISRVRHHFGIDAEAVDASGEVGAAADAAGSATAADAGAAGGTEILEAILELALL